MIKIRKVTPAEKQAFSKNLKKLRESKNVDIDEIAEKCNVKTEVVAKWENGEKFPKLNTVKKIAKELNIDPDEMLNITTKIDVINSLSEKTKSQVIRLLQVFIKTRSDVNKNEINALIDLLKGENR